MASSDVAVAPNVASRTQRAFVFLFDDIGRMYVVTNHHNELSAPGGKRENNDATIFDTARRGFKEETSSDLPEGDYHHFSWTDKDYETWVYYRTISRSDAERLHAGIVTDVDGYSMDSRWGKLSVNDERWRHYIQFALKLHMSINRELGSIW